jgi:hypothetical protein
VAVSSKKGPVSKPAKPAKKAESRSDDRSSVEEAKPAKKVVPTSAAAPLFIQFSDKTMGKCLLCKKVLKFNGMKAHLRSHKNCYLCGAGFAGKDAASSLRKHIVTCQKRKTYVLNCIFCKRNFKFPSKRLAHQKYCTWRRK